MTPPSPQVARWCSEHLTGQHPPVGLAIVPGAAFGLAAGQRTDLSEPATGRTDVASAIQTIRVPSGAPPSVSPAGPPAIWCRSAQPADDIGWIDETYRPRWVWWDRNTADALASAGIGVDRSWDLLATHRLLRGGHCPSVQQMWCERHHLDPNLAPRWGQLDLLQAPAETPADQDEPILASGYLAPGWDDDGFEQRPQRLAPWAALALTEYRDQLAEIERLGEFARNNEPDQPTGWAPTARRMQRNAAVESATEFLCAELGARGLPFDADVAASIIVRAVGERPHDEAHEQTLRAERDEAVFDLAPPGPTVDLRNPAGVNELLRRIGLHLADTRAWRLREHADNDLVAALLKWRKAERIATTYGYRWLDQHVRGRRLRGTWSASDGAAGRMTATAGLHNLPAELRPAVIADAGHHFVRADLGQVEPRVLAALSGDDALTAATAGDDLYLLVARRLGVERSVAKLAVLGAMYGSTTGQAAHALRNLDRAYPQAMAFLERIARRGRDGRRVLTHGGRPVPLWEIDSDGDLDRAAREAAARGRFARNAVVQGAAAELFKMWAVTVRSRVRAFGGEVVLCLHDELLVHTPSPQVAATQRAVTDALEESARRWAPRSAVRFVADVSAVRSWADVSSPTTAHEANTGG